MWYVMGKVYFHDVAIFPFLKNYEKMKKYDRVPMLFHPIQPSQHTFSKKII